MSLKKCLLAFCLWVGVTSWIVVKEARPPATDIFLFKEAGVNWAQTGKFQVKNLPHMPPNEAMTYAYYPPLYPLLFGVWTKAFGIGLRQSIAFDSILRALRTALIFLLATVFAQGWARGTPFGSAKLLLVGVILSLVSSDGDRPDELALVLGLLSWLSLYKLPYEKWWFTAVLLGLCGATSPAGGLLFAAGVAVVLAKEKRWMNLCGIGGVAFLCFLICNFSFYTEGWTAFLRFRAQATLSNFPYLAPWKAGWGAFFVTWNHAFQHSVKVGAPYLLSFCILATGVGYTLFENRRNLPPLLRLTWFLAMGYAVVCLWVWTLQPYYFWMASIPLLAVALALPSFWNRSNWGMTIVLVLALTPIFQREFKGYLHALQRPPGQQSETIAREVLTHLDPKATLAIEPDQYFTFRGIHPVDNLTYVCEHLNEYQYVYATPRTTRRDRAVPTPILCANASDCFTLVEDQSSREVFEVLGFETPYFVRGNGGALYENTKCLSSVDS